MNINKAVGKYLRDTIGIKARFSAWKDPETMPFALRNAYSFTEVGLLGHKYLLLHGKSDMEMTPATIAKHLNWVESQKGLCCIFSTESMESYNRKRLIEHKVPFIVPGNQLYLPDLGIDLREYIKKIRIKKPALSPSGQFIVLLFTLKRFTGIEWTATKLSEQLPYSKMSMSRALEELADLEIIEVKPIGRERIAIFKDEGRDLWEKTKVLMKSPVQRRIYLDRMSCPIGLLAGLSALAEQTTLVAPNRMTTAVTSKEWKALQIDTSLRMIPKSSRDLAPIELEIWRYNPAVLSRNGLVDPLSLFLSLQQEDDERVENALEQLIDDLPW